MIKLQRLVAVSTISVLALVIAGRCFEPPEVWADFQSFIYTSTAVPASGTMTMTVNTAGVTLVYSRPATSCPLTGLGTATVTYTCDQYGPGIPAGTELLQSFSGSGLISETVTYNANGPLTGATPSGVHAQGNCGGTFGGGSGSGRGGTSERLWFCSVSTPALTVPGGKLGITIFQSGTFQLTEAPLMVSGCYPDSPLTLPVASQPLYDNLEIYYQCSISDYKSIPAGTPITLRGATTGPAPFTADAFVLTPRSADIPIPTTQTIPISASGPLPGGSNPATTPTLTAINPPTGSNGVTVTLSGANLRGLAITLGGTPGVSTPVGPSGGTTITFGPVGATSVVCNDTGTSCTATAPAISPGSTVDVSATTTAGTSNRVSFTYAGP